jgi:hypothetical protein
MPFHTIIAIERSSVNSLASKRYSPPCIRTAPRTGRIKPCAPFVVMSFEYAKIRLVKIPLAIPGTRNAGKGKPA